MSQPEHRHPLWTQHGQCTLRKALGGILAAVLVCTVVQAAVGGGGGGGPALLVLPESPVSPTAAHPIPADQCGRFTTDAEASDDCNVAFEYAQRYENLWGFFHQCRTEGGSKPLRSRCNKCCHDESAEHECSGVNPQCASASASEEWCRGLSECNWVPKASKPMPPAPAPAPDTCHDVIEGVNSPDRCNEFWVCNDEWWAYTHCQKTCGVCRPGDAPAPVPEPTGTCTHGSQKNACGPCRVEADCGWNPAVACWRVPDATCKAPPPAPPAPPPAPAPAPHPFCSANFNSDDCWAEYGNAQRNGNMDYFFGRCRHEGGADPLRKRCALCCEDPHGDHGAHHGGHRPPHHGPGFKCAEGFNSGDCLSEFGNAKRNGNMSPFYNRCRTEGGADPLRKRCALCCGGAHPKPTPPAPRPVPPPAPPVPKPTPAPTPTPTDACTGHTPSLPELPANYALTVSYAIHGARYETARSYQLTGPGAPMFREDDIGADGKVTATTIELPADPGAAFRYSAATGECESWQFTSKVDGFPMLYHTAPYEMKFSGTETVQGVEADKFTIVFGHWWQAAGQGFGERTYSVWFKHCTNIPLQVYDSTAQVDGHMFHVSHFTTAVDLGSFAVPDAWKCPGPTNMLQFLDGLGDMTPAPAQVVV